MRVSWRPLSRSEARGFITNYTITYWRVGSNAANASTITVSGEDASSAIIINLDPNSDYYFTVSTGTVQGVGKSIPGSLFTSLMKCGLVSRL